MSLYTIPNATVATPSGAASGDLSGTFPSPTVTKLNGTALSGLATGLLKNTTSTGVPSVAVAGTDYVAGTVAPQIKQVLLGKLTSANLNTTADQGITIASTKYIVRRILVTNASATPVLAAGGFYTAASKGGSKIIETTQVFTALTGSSKWLDLTLLTIATTDTFTAASIFLSLTVAQGTAITADVYIFGDDLT